MTETSPRLRRRVRTTRLLFLIAAIVYPLFWLVRGPGSTHDPVEIRLVVSGVALLLLLLSFSPTFSRRWLHPLVMALVYLITAHFFYLLATNHLDPEYLIGLLIVLAAINAAATLAFAGARSLLAYLSAVVAAALLTAWIVEDPLLDLGFYLLVVITAAGLSYVALSAQLTARREAREGRRRLEAVVKGAPIALWSLDADGRIEFLAGRSLGALGWDREKSEGARIEELFGPDPEIVEAVDAALGGAISQVVVEVGDTVLETWHAPLQDQVGENRGVIGVATDVTERQRAEDRLRERERTLAEAQAVARLGSWEWHVEEDRAPWSDEMYRIFGYEPGEIEMDYATYLDHVHEDDAERVDSAIRRALESGDSYAFEHRLVRPDGEVREASVTARIVRDDDGSPLRVIGTLHDVTEQREIERELRQGQKLEAMGRLAGGVAHDFNNVLVAVKGYCDLLIPSLEDDDESLDHVLEIRHAAQRAEDLVGQLLSFGRKQELRKQVLNVNSVIREMRGLLRQAVGPGVELRVELTEAPPIVEADLSGLEQVLMNLVMNARDAMDGSGTIRIATGLVPAGEVDDLSADLEPREHVELVVHDDGCGIEPETLERVFEPFFTTKAEGKGTGLGLATVYGVVEQSGGAITVESEPGEGTTFRVFLPLRDDDFDRDPPLDRVGETGAPMRQGR